MVLDLIIKARREGCDHRLLLFDSVFRNDRLDFPPGDIPICFEKRRPGFDWTLPGRVARHLERGACDALHAHNDTAVFYGALAVIHPRKAGAALIATFHTMPAAATRAGKALTNLATRWATHLTAVSPEMVPQACAEGWVSRSRRSLVRDPSRGIQPWRPNCEVTDDRPHRPFQPGKAPVRSAGSLSHAPRGGPPDGAGLRGTGRNPRRSAKSGIRLRRRRGRAKFARNCAFLHEIDIFVIYYRARRAPRVRLLEAMACGRAIVATAVGGIPEMLTDADGHVCGRPARPRRPIRWRKPSRNWQVQSRCAAASEQLRAAGDGIFRGTAVERIRPPLRQPRGPAQEPYSFRLGSCF